MDEQLSTDKADVKRGLDQARTLAITACSGLGGIGKSRLALEYIHNPSHLYVLRAWFPSENVEQLKTTLIEFAKALGLKGDKILMDQALGYINRVLEQHPSWLLVFDNASNYESIKDYLPKARGSIIITSRHQVWPALYNVLQINVMTEDEALQLIESISKRDISKEQKS